MNRRQSNIIAQYRLPRFKADSTSLMKTIMLIQEKYQWTEYKKMNKQFQNVVINRLSELFRILHQNRLFNVFRKQMRTHKKVFDGIVDTYWNDKLKEILDCTFLFDRKDSETENVMLSADLQDQFDKVMSLVSVAGSYSKSDVFEEIQKMEGQKVTNVIVVNSNYIQIICTFSRSKRSSNVLLHHYVRKDGVFQVTPAIRFDNQNADRFDTQDADRFDTPDADQLTLMMQIENFFNSFVLDSDDFLDFSI